MIPGEILTDDGEHELNAGRATLTLVVANTGDRPVQVGSHYHFFEVNDALSFDRAAARAEHRGRHRGALRAGPDAHRRAGRARGRSCRLRFSGQWGRSKPRPLFRNST